MTELTTDETTIITTLRARGETGGSGSAETVDDLTPAERERIGRGGMSVVNGPTDQENSNTDGGLADPRPSGSSESTGGSQTMPVDNGPTDQRDREPESGLSDPSMGGGSSSSDGRDSAADVPAVPDQGSDSSGDGEGVQFLPSSSSPGSSSGVTDSTALIIAGAVVAAAVIAG